MTDQDKQRALVETAHNFGYQCAKLYFWLHLFHGLREAKSAAEIGTMLATIGGVDEDDWKAVIGDVADAYRHWSHLMREVADCDAARKAMDAKRFPAEHIACGDCGFVHAEGDINRDCRPDGKRFSETE